MCEAGEGFRFAGGGGVAGQGARLGAPAAPLRPNHLLIRRPVRDPARAGGG